jgi:type II secretory pathway predicted ATPase ExeA/LysM repeat protein
MGKTTLLFQFLHDIRNSARSVFLFNTQCEPQGLLRDILRDLGIAPAIKSDEMHDQLKGVLLKEARVGRSVVVVVDEAQNLSDEALEMLRLLTNFETPRAKLLQIVLAGQLQLSDKLQKPSLEQLRQRISTVCWLEPLATEERVAYIRHRLTQAGYKGAPPFTKDALELITAASLGIPRIINTLCFNALSLCRALKCKQVDGNMVAEAIADLELVPPSRESVALSEAVAAKQPLGLKQSLQVEQPIRSEPPKPRGATKLLGATAAVLLLASGLGLLSHSAHWQSWPYLTGYTHSLDSRTLSALAAAATTKDANEKIAAAQPPQTTPRDFMGMSTLIPAPATANTGEVTVDERSSIAKQFQITVEPNQTLHEIALRYLGIWDQRSLYQIQALNPIVTDLDYIQAGQKIWLPAHEPALTEPNEALQTNGGNRHEP